MQPKNPKKKNLEFTLCPVTTIRVYFKLDRLERLEPRAQLSSPRVLSVGHSASKSLGFLFSGAYASALDSAAKS